MASWAVILIALGGLPVLIACWANRRNSLIHALGWALAAWGCWLISGMSGAILVRYFALCLTGCAGVAVLGARRPGVTAWHAVVAGLLAVLLIAPAEGLLSGAPLSHDTLQIVFLSAALFVGLANYLPTSLGLGALALIAACIIELRRIGSPIPDQERVISLALAGAAPWLAWLGRMVRVSKGIEVDRLWRDLRDRCGVVWGERVREQFNHAAKHAGLNVTMGWFGLRSIDQPQPTENEQAASVELLSALLKRFGPAA
jgi:hypothetical protein